MARLRVRGPWRGRPREQRASECEAHQMAELSRGTVLGKYKGEAQKSGRCKKAEAQQEGG